MERADPIRTAGCGQRRLDGRHRPWPNGPFGTGPAPRIPAVKIPTARTDSLGIPVANILREQAKELRLKRRQRAEEQAQKVPIKILFPMLLFIFPALFVVIIGPAAIKIFHAFAG